MPAIVVEARDLGKIYRIPTTTEGRYHTVREDLAVVGRRLTRRARERHQTEIRALDGVSFRVEAGETVGLLGRNGAGKSTLLKILSRVTKPSVGHADTYGKVGALLEIGTGFHPELTGRENVYLSGAILGLSRKDVASRFDAIVGFAEVGAFIDTPVKRYSSGMYARLGFAVAAHLRPALLIVDEVLSVGDLAFQAKCLAHMRQLADDGTAVLFVSHNLLAVADFCTRAILLSEGRLVGDGSAPQVITQFRRVLALPATDRGSEQEAARVLAVRANGVEVGESVTCEPHAELTFEFELESRVSSGDLVLNLVAESADGRTAMHLRSDVSGARLLLRPGINRFRVSVSDLSMAPGDYWIWARFVGLDASPPLILDSVRYFLEVSGANPLDTFAWPNHSFAQLGSELDDKASEVERGPSMAR